MNGKKERNIKETERNKINRNKTKRRPGHRPSPEETRMLFAGMTSPMIYSVHSKDDTKGPDGGRHKMRVETHSEKEMKMFVCVERFSKLRREIQPDGFVLDLIY